MKVKRVHIEEMKRVNAVSKSRPVRLTVGQRISFELAKLAIGTTITCVALAGIYNGAQGVANIGDQVISKIKGEAVQPIERKIQEIKHNLVSLTHIWPVVNSAAAAHDMDPHLILAIVQKESSFVSTARNKGALGLMQLRPKTRAYFGLSDNDALDPITNIEAGTAWLKIKTREQSGNEDEAIQSYYCGTSRVDCIGKPRGIGYLKAVRVIQAQIKKTKKEV